MCDLAKPRIGVVGPGRMGLAIVKHLVRNGYPVIATDIGAAQLKQAEAAGAQTAASPAEVGKVSDFVISAVGYDDEATAVMTGPKGLLETMKKGSIIAISSTCAPETVEKLDALARADVGVPLIGAVRELVKEGRKIKQTNPPDWTGTGTDLG